MIYVPIDADGFADRENMTIAEPAEGEWQPFDTSFNGLYRPKWAGNGWIEGATPEEIEAMNPPPLPPAKTPEQLRIEQLETEQALMRAALDELILGGGL